MTFLNCGWRKRRSTRTTMVLFILSETTSPTRSLRRPRSALVSVMVPFQAALWRSWEIRVSMRAMSRRNSRNRAGFSNWALAFCKRRLNNSCRRSRLLAVNSAGVKSFNSDIFMFHWSALGQVVAGDKSRFNGQLGRRQAHRLARHRLRHSVDFKQHVGRTDHRHPALDAALARAHAHFERFFCDRLVRKYAQPDLAAPLHEARDRHARGLDLLRVQPAALQRLQSVFAKRDGRAARRDAGAVTAVHLAILHSFGHQGHNQVLVKISSPRRRSCRRVWFRAPLSSRLCKSSTSLRACHRRYWPRRNRSRCSPAA